MSLRSNISKKIGLYLDPEVSVDKLLFDLDKGGKFDKKMIRDILVEIIEYLDKPKK